VPDHYPVPTAPATGEFRDRGSKFVAALLPVRSEEEALAAVAEQQRLHPKCNHHCYAYRLGEGPDRYRANDDGEPSGTAGKPILGQMDKAALSDIVIIVSRYYGGTKLGTSGLINAYREAARRAIEAAPIGDRLLTTRLTLTFGYERMSDVMSALSQLQLEMAESDFGETATVILDLPRSSVPETVQQLEVVIGSVDIGCLKHPMSTNGRVLISVDAA
jgi:uncharacterized YigZ family protein